MISGSFGDFVTEERSNLAMRKTRLAYNWMTLGVENDWDILSMNKDWLKIQKVEEYAQKVYFQNLGRDFPSSHEKYEMQKFENEFERLNKD